MSIMKTKLYRSKKDKILGGVCGGLAGYFKVDSLVVRAVFILLLLSKVFAGAVILLYILALILVPVEEKTPTETSEPPRQVKRTDSARHRGMFVGIALLILGVIALLTTMGSLIPLQVLIAVGFIVLGTLV